MSHGLKRVVFVARLDLAEVLRSRWVFFLSLLYCVIAALFILVGLRESSVLGFTGMGRVLMSLCNALVVLLPLLALTASGQVINRAREDGTLELLFSNPLSRNEYFAAISMVRYLTVTVPLFILILILALYAWVAYGQPVPWGFVGRALAILATLTWAFVGVGLAVSVWVFSEAKAMVYLLVIWVVSAALMDFGLIGLMLAWRIEPAAVFIIASLNPVEMSRMALLSAADPSLATLGPVGFYLANRVGRDWLLLLGVFWPLVVGTLAWLSANWRFNHGDLA